MRRLSKKLYPSNDKKKKKCCDVQIQTGVFYFLHFTDTHQFFQCAMRYDKKGK